MSEHPKGGAPFSTRRGFLKNAAAAAAGAAVIAPGVLRVAGAPAAFGSLTRQR